MIVLITSIFNFLTSYDSSILRVHGRFLGHVQNCTFARDVALELSRAHTNDPPGPRNHSYEIGPLTISRAHGAQNSEARSSG